MTDTQGARANRTARHDPRFLPTQTPKQPAQVWPVAFELGHGESVELRVNYVPSEPGTHTAGLLLLCDDCTLRQVCACVCVCVGV
jgi:hypothetical protein